MAARLNRKMLLIGGVLLALVLAFFVLGTGSDTRMVSAHFNEAISVYKGSDVDIMGIRVGRVTAVVPEGKTVRVDMEYDSKYRLPANVSAAIVTPSLVADRFIQLAPAYGGGAALANHGDIPASRSHEPVELDRIYASLSDLSKTLGPDGANKNGALNTLLAASAKALNGNGAAGNAMLSNLGAAAQVLGDNSQQFFSTINNLAQVTAALQQNDSTVSSFLGHLATVSTQLAGERDDLQQALAAIASAVGTVQSFVHDNKTMAIQDLQQLTTTLQVLADQKDTLGKVLQIAPQGLNNLTEAYDASTGTIGIRVQLGPEATDLGNVICGVLTVNKMPNVDQVCTLLRALLPGNTNIGAGLATPGAGTASNVAPAPPNGLAGILNPVLRGAGL